MPVKSIIDVEVNDEQFKDFAKLFEKYQAALGATPGVWAKAETATAGTALNVENLVAALLTHEAINRKIARDEAAKTRELEKQNRAVAYQRVAYKDVARSVLSVGASIAKWASYGGIATGLLGSGSLLGLDRLANLTGEGRQRAQGLGTGYGAAKAFDNSFGRLVNTDALLGGVNESLTDATKRAPLFGAGLSQGDLAGGDSAQVGVKLLDAVKKLVDKTPTELLGNVAAARGLGQFGFTTESLRTLKGTSAEEYASIRKGFADKSKDFDVDDGIARKWQNLGIQLDAAKVKLEGVIVKGLEPLADPLSHLSDSFANAVKNFLTGLDPKTIGDIGKGIEDFGKYLGSPSFRKDLKEFSDDVSYAAKQIVTALKWLHLIPDNKDAAGNADPGAPGLVDKAKKTAAYTAAGAAIGGTIGALGGPGGALVGAQIGAWAGGAAGVFAGRGGRLLGENAHWTGAPNETNPGNIRFPGQNKGFAAFADPYAGVRAIARQVGLYEKRDHLDTIEKIIAKYAPAKDGNNVKAYVDDVSKYSGIKADQKLDANDVDQVSRIVAGITKHEGVRRYNASTVKVIIQNNTGGSAVVQSSQAAKQG